MLKGETKYIYRRFCAFVLTAICASSWFLVWLEFVQDHNQTGHLLGAGNLLMSLFVYLVLLIYFMHLMGGFRIGVDRKMNTIASQVTALLLTDVTEGFASLVITGQFRFFWDFFWRYLLHWIAMSMIIGFLTVKMINLYRRLFPPLRVIEIYEDAGESMKAKMETRPDKYCVCRRLSCNESEAVIRKMIEEYDAVLLNDVSGEKRDRLLNYCFAHNKRVYLVPTISDLFVNASEDLNLFDTPVFLRRNLPRFVGHDIIKRVMDIALSIILLILTLPLFIGVSIAIRREDNGPVFYLQDRVTLGGRVFRLIKFRSMRVDAESDGKPHPAVPGDPRVTRIGRIIRPRRIDELPQLFNVLQGTMSLVGPRPERVENVQKYTEEIPEFAYRTKVKSGMTGYAQVYGRYDTPAIDKLKLDLVYIMNQSFLLDTQILFETIRVLFQKERAEGFPVVQNQGIKPAGEDDAGNRVDARI